MTSMIPEPQMPVMPVSRDAVANAGSSDQASTPMTRKRGSSVSRSIRTRSMAPGAARWPPVIWAPSKAGPVGLDAASSRRLSPEDDLGVRADVDDERHPLGLVRLLGEDHAGRVGPDVAGDAGQDVDARARMGAEPELRRGRVDGPVRGERERRAAERRRVDAEQEVMHDRVADQRELEDLDALDPGPHRERGDQPVECLADRDGHLAGALGMHHRVRDAAHQVLAEADLRVHHAVAGEDRAVGQVGEVAGDRRRADVDRDAVGRFVEAGPDRDDLVGLVDRDRDAVLPRLERRLEGAHDLEIRLEIGQLPLALERLEQPGEVAGRRRELRRGDLDVVQPDDRIDDEVRTSRPLRTTWRWTWLSGGTSMRTSPQTWAVHDRRRSAARPFSSR